MLIVIEGINGCGKTSLIDALCEQFSARTIAFPNDNGFTGKAIRSYLKNEWYATERLEIDTPNSKLGAMCLQALQAANRLEVMDQLETAAGDQASHLILSRYWQSGWVYGQIDDLPRKWLYDIHRSMARADMNFLLDISPDEAFRRRAKRDGKVLPDRYESKLEVRQVELYRELWESKEAFDYFGGRWSIVDASKPFDEVLTLVADMIDLYSQHPIDAPA